MYSYLDDDHEKNSYTLIDTKDLTPIAHSPNFNIADHITLQTYCKKEWVNTSSHGHFVFVAHDKTHYMRQLYLHY